MEKKNRPTAVPMLSPILSLKRPFENSGAGMVPTETGPMNYAHLKTCGCTGRGDQVVIKINYYLLHLINVLVLLFKSCILLLLF